MDYFGGYGMQGNSEKLLFKNQKKSENNKNKISKKRIFLLEPSTGHSEDPIHHKSEAEWHNMWPEMHVLVIGYNARLGAKTDHTTYRVANAGPKNPKYSGYN